MSGNENIVGNCVKAPIKAYCIHTIYISLSKIVSFITHIVIALNAIQTDLLQTKTFILTNRLVLFLIQHIIDTIAK